jgi:hypothetical protein
MRDNRQPATTEPENDIVGSRRQATSSADKLRILTLGTTVTCKVCKLAIVLYLVVVTIYK